LRDLPAQPGSMHIIHQLLENVKQQEGSVLKANQGCLSIWGRT
jgi:hypothetical protein